MSVQIIAQAVRRESEIKLTFRLNVVGKTPNRGEVCLSLREWREVELTYPKQKNPFTTSASPSRRLAKLAARMQITEKARCGLFVEHSNRRVSVLRWEPPQSGLKILW
jgi:hypothetical protein